MNIFRTLFLTSSLVVFSVGAACATPNTDPNADIPNIVITPTRTAVDANKIGSTVTVITRREIEQKHASTVVELLRDIPGLAIAGTGGVGQTARTFIRGAESRHTLVIIDGVSVNDPSDPAGAFDFANLTTDNIERIEILRGSQSTLYGSDAIGGVINIITRKGAGKPKHFASVEGGSFDTYKVSAGSSGQVGGVGYSLSASHFDTGGISAFSEKSGGVEKDGNTARTFSGSLSKDLNEYLTLDGTLRYNRNWAEYDDSGADAANESKSDQLNGRVAAKLKLLDGKWTHEIGVGSLLVDRIDISSYGVSTYRGERNKLDWVQNYQVAPGHLSTLGLESSDDVFKTESIAERSVRTNSVFVQHQIDLWDSFYVSLGGRYDDNAQFGSNTTYHIAPAYRFKETGTKLKASYGTGFKAPALYQLYSIYGNTSLSPEKSKSYDVGFEQFVWNSRIKVGSSYFHNDFDNLIDYDFSTNKYINVGTAETHGVENTLRFALTPELAFTASYTYLLTEDASHKNLLRRPKHRGGASLDYDSGDLHLGLGTRSVGSRNDVNLSFARDIAPSYTTVNADASYRINEMATLTGRLENLFDKQYEEVLGYGSPGFSAYTGMRLDF